MACEEWWPTTVNDSRRGVCVDCARVPEDLGWAMWDADIVSFDQHGLICSDCEGKRHERGSAK